MRMTEPVRAAHAAVDVAVEAAARRTFLRRLMRLRRRAYRGRRNASRRVSAIAA